MSVLSRSKKAPADGAGSGGPCRTLAAAAEAAPATAARLLRSCLRLLLNWSGGPGLGLGLAARLARPGTGSRPRSCLMAPQFSDLGGSGLPGHPSGRILGAREAP